MNDHPQPVSRETYAPSAVFSNPSRLEQYLESWDMLEESTLKVQALRQTLAGCLPPGEESKLDMYKDSLEMLDEFHASTKQQNLEAMGFFVHGVLLRELAKLERRRESLGLQQAA